MFLKTYEGDASDLCLTFAVAKDDFGSQEEVPLIPGGNNMDVTNANKHQYVGKFEFLKRKPPFRSIDMLIDVLLVLVRVGCETLCMQ